MAKSKIAISTLPCMGLGVVHMQKIPKEMGIEIFSECGNDYYWKYWLPRLLEGREGEFSVHAPFHNLDLSNPQADFEEIRANYRWAIEICSKHGGEHLVCHPYDSSRPSHETEEALKAAQKCSEERVLILNEDAKKYGVTLLVENMPHERPLFSCEEFVETFGKHEELHFLIDTGHAHVRDWDMDYVFEKIGDRILGYHLHDNMGDKDSHLYVGEGTFNWDKFWKGYFKYTPEASLVCEYDNGPIEKVLESAREIQELINKNNKS